MSIYIYIYICVCVCVCVLIHIGREENDRRNYFMINLPESIGPGRVELAIPGSAVRYASVARHVTDCATRPGLCFFHIQKCALVHIRIKSKIGVVNLV